MKALTGLWDRVRKAGKSLDALDVDVRRATQRPLAKGRELPFFYTSRFLYTNGDMTERESPLVQSADRITKITRLTYSVFAISPPGELPIAGNAEYQTTIQLRPSRTGMFNQWLANTAAATMLFDFDWTFRIGSTGRSYSNGRTVEGQPFNSRIALGNPELPNARLLFSPENPLTLQTNEFLSFVVRPTLYNPGAVVPTTSPEVAPYFVVEIQAAGFRSFDNDA